ncbi:hypothetical protein [Kitasatospora sp. NPDC059599]|uniref:hypothetical protein n=1 Tax=Kitasatospora sp. NPDC059599 TaxID=3346880 RepID=UPI00368569AA
MSAGGGRGAGNVVESERGQPARVDEIADALYALAPPDFTAARNARAHEVKKTDPPLAKRIRALHRPTLAAWAANLLAHQHREPVEQLLDLGQALRDAQDHLVGDQLHALADQRRRLVQALTEQARQDAGAAGHPLGANATADLDRTLSAALADPDAARALSEGRLTTALDPPLWPGTITDATGPGGTAGLGEAGGTAAGQTDVPPGAAAGPDTTARRARPAAQRRPDRTCAAPPDDRDPAPARARAERERARARARERKEAQAAVTAAERAEREAAERADAADRELRTARSARQSAQSEADQTAGELLHAQQRHDQARDTLDQADNRLRTAETDHDCARTQAAQAHQALQKTAERLRQLEDDGHGGRAG